MDSPEAVWMRVSLTHPQFAQWHNRVECVHACRTREIHRFFVRFDPLLDSFLFAFNKMKCGILIGVLKRNFSCTRDKPGPGWLVEYGSGWWENIWLPLFEWHMKTMRQGSSMRMEVAIMEIGSFDLIYFAISVLRNSISSIYYLLNIAPRLSWVRESWVQIPPAENLFWLDIF